MVAGISSEDTVITVGVNLCIKLDVCLYQCFTVLHEILQVYVVVCTSMDEQQLSFQLGCTADGRRSLVTVTIFLRCAHEAFGID